MYTYKLEEIKRPEYTKPPKRLVESMRTIGQLVPILINPRREILDGRRRYYAAKLLKWETIDAIVVHDGNSAHTLQAHVRSENPVAQYEAVKDLIASGYTDAQIAELVGGKKRLEKILSLGNLEPRLLGFVESGEVSASVAFKLARMSKVEQASAMTWFDDMGKLTSIMLKDIRSSQRTYNVETLELPIPQIPIEHKLVRVKLVLELAKSSTDLDDFVKKFQETVASS